MKKIILTSTFCLLLFAGCSQGKLQIETIINKKSTNWKISNPVLVKTNKSFFTQGNYSRYFVFPIETNDKNIFAWDCDYSILSFVLNGKPKHSVKTGNDADPRYQGIKIDFFTKIPVSLIIANNLNEGIISNWYLRDSTFSDCPKTKVFPVVYISTSSNFPVSSEGLAVLHENDEKVKFNKNIVKCAISTEDNREIKGECWDIDNDQTPDVFWFWENVNETIGYKRLYLNVDGEWICTWAEYYKECI